MKLPDNKKYLMYIKVAKTGGSSFKMFLEKISEPKYFRIIDGKRVLDEIKDGDTIILINDNVNLFKKKYKYIFDNSFKILITRNPYSKIISCYNYHPFIKRKKINLLMDLLKNKEYVKYDSSEIDYKIDAPKELWVYYSFFTHFYLLQTNGLVENNKLIVDKVIKFENLNEETYDFFKQIDVNIKNIKLEHLNKEKKKRIENL